MPNSSTGLINISIFLASPSDVGEEREAVMRVVARLSTNPPWSSRCHFTLLKYEDAVPPDAGIGPQKIVDAHMRKASEADIVVCLFNQRLGTPVMDEASGRQYDSGTLYEFYHAYEARLKGGDRPIIMLYWIKQDFSSDGTDEEWQQFRKVRDFFKLFDGPDPKLKGLPETIQSRQQFEHKFREDLEQHLANMLDEVQREKPKPFVEDGIVIGLAEGFRDVIELLLEVDCPVALQAKRDRIKKWCELADSGRWMRQGVNTALTRMALDDQDEEALMLRSKLLTKMNAAGWMTHAPQLMAAVVLESVRESMIAFPEYLLQILSIFNSPKTERLVSFVIDLRYQLSLVEGYSDVISYANELFGRGIMEGFADKIANSVDYISRIQVFIKNELKSRGYTQQQGQALDDYLSYLRDHQLNYSQLPLARGTTQDRSDARLKDIYVPIAVRSQEKSKQVQSVEKGRSAGGDSSQSTPDQEGTLGELLLGKRKLVLLGPPGGGKTTLLRHLALVLAEGRSIEIPGWSVDYGAVPFFLRLRSFAVFLQGDEGSKFTEPCSASLIAYLEHFYEKGERLGLTPDFFEKLLEEGGCAVFMDGMDEVPLLQRETVALHVKEFIARYGQDNKTDLVHESRERILNNIFVITSRPKGYESVSFYLEPFSFAVREVKPLEPAGIRQLVNNLLNFIELNKDQRAEDYDGICDAILESDNLTLLAGTPLFCTSLVLMYKYHGAELPQRRVDVFGEIVNLLLGFWKAQDLNMNPYKLQEEDEGLSTDYMDLKTFVYTQKRRLGHIALQMQYGEKRVEIDFPALVDIFSKYLEEEEGKERTHAGKYARRFLMVSHERSGLLVEMEATNPPSYSFTHDGFREYLVADALVNLQVQNFTQALLDHVDNTTWEEVIIMAGAHAELSRGTREYLLDRFIADAARCRDIENWDGWTRRLTIAGRMARDMKGYLTEKDKVKLKKVLLEGLDIVGDRLKSRSEIALILDELGWLTESLYQFAKVRSEAGKVIFIGINPVVNQQYRRFVDSPDFDAPAYWSEFDAERVNGGMFSLEHRYYRGEKDGRAPKSWNDPKFGHAHPGLPVVGISWFEANAYCKWLCVHWRELEEGLNNPEIRPLQIMLPSEREWNLAVNVYDQATEVQVSNANFGNIIDRTLPVGAFIKTFSRPNGLVDTIGNIWEWQRNFYDRSLKGIALTGGAFTTEKEDILPGLRGWRDPTGRDNDIGFRIVIEVE